MVLGDAREHLGCGGIQRRFRDRGRGTQARDLLRQLVASQPAHHVLDADELGVGEQRPQQAFEVPGIGRRTRCAGRRARRASWRTSPSCSSGSTSRGRSGRARPLLGCPHNSRRTTAARLRRSRAPRGTPARTDASERSTTVGRPRRSERSLRGRRSTRRDPAAFISARTRASRACGAHRNPHGRDARGRQCRCWGWLSRSVIGVVTVIHPKGE